MSIPGTGQADIYRRNAALLKKRFPKAAKRMDASIGDASQPFFTAEGNNRLRTICVQCGDGRSQPFYQKGADDQLRQKVAAANAPESCDVIFFIGIGLGRAALDAVRMYTNRPRIVIVEPFPGLLKLAIENTDLETLLTCDRLKIYLGNDANAERVIGDCQDILPVGRTLLFIHPYRYHMIDERYGQLVSDLTHQIRSVRDRWHTIRRFGGQMLANSVSNLPSLLKGAPLRALRGRFKDIPAICIAAGPSLNQALPLLKRVKNTLLIACDSAVGSLLGAGIRPHIVATADIHPANIAKLKPNMEKLCASILAFGVESNPENVHSFLGSRQVGMTAYSKLVLDWLDAELNLQCAVPPMTSVTHLAVSLAMAMGADPIVLVGVDLAYLDGQSHSQGSVFTRIPPKEKLIAIPGADGNTVFSPPQLVTDRLVLEQNIQRQPCRVISTSLRGALINGAELKPLERVIDTELQKPVDVKGVLDAITWSPQHDHTAISVLLSLVNDRLIELKENCGYGYTDAQNVSQTLSNRDVECDLKDMYDRCMDDYGRLIKKYDRVIRIFLEAMLQDEQAIVKREEEIAASVNSSREKKISDRLETLLARYRVLTEFAEHVSILIGSLQEVNKNGL